MRKFFPLFLFAAIAVSFAHADPPDAHALPDGGTLVTSKGGPPGDGGGPWVTVDTGQVNDWVATMRARSYLGSPAVHYRFSADAGTATTDDSVIDVDRTMDIPVSQGQGEKYRYLSLLGEDGGPPSLILFKNAR